MNVADLERQLALAHLVCLHTLTCLHEKGLHQIVGSVERDRQRLRYIGGTELMTVMTHRRDRS